MRSRATRLADWAFRSRKTGEITIVQIPNLPLFIFGVCVVAGWLLQAIGQAHGSLDQAVGILGTLALAWWAIGEVLRGVNPWRRLLGAVGLVFVAMGLLRISQMF